jgi:hypothetical protein
MAVNCDAAREHREFLYDAMRKKHGLGDLYRACRLFPQEPEFGAMTANYQLGQSPHRMETPA